MNKKRNIIIGVLLLLVVMTMGYALFSETVTIGGTAKADGNASLDLYNPDGTTGLDLKVNGVGSSGTAKIDPSRKILTVTANLDYPTAYVEIPVKVKNTGDIDLYVSDVNINGTVLLSNGDLTQTDDLLNLIENNFDLFTYEGLNKYDLIKANTEKNIVIKVKWIENDLGYEEFLKNITFNLSITGVQEINDTNTGLPSSPFIVGQEYCLNGNEDCFNLIKDNGDSVTMLAKNTLDRNCNQLKDNYQTSDVYNVSFAEKIVGKKPNSDYYAYWTDDNGALLPEYGSTYPTDVYNKAPNSNPNLLKDNVIVTMVNNYVNKLKGIKHIPENDKTSLTGRLIYVSELADLGFRIEDGLFTGNFNDLEWLANGQHWWSGSAYNNYELYHVSGYGILFFSSFRDGNSKGVRPVIKIYKKYLK